MKSEQIPHNTCSTVKHDRSGPCGKTARFIINEFKYCRQCMEDAIKRMSWLKEKVKRISDEIS